MLTWETTKCQLYIWRNWKMICEKWKVRWFFKISFPFKTIPLAWIEKKTQELMHKEFCFNDIKYECLVPRSVLSILLYMFRWFISSLRSFFILIDILLTGNDLNLSFEKLLDFLQVSLIRDIYIYILVQPSLYQKSSKSTDVSEHMSYLISSKYSLKWICWPFCSV